LPLIAPRTVMLRGMDVPISRCSIRYPLSHAAV
jgi:hypothetical protein